jgi:hypothetical protein
MAASDYYTVSTSFIGSLHGGGVEYRKGEVVSGDDPALKRWPEYFEPLVVREHLVERPVEQATAAPGEKRNVVRRAVRKVSKPKAAPKAEEPPAGKAITTTGFKGR